MLFKTISITLPEKMICQIDEVLASGDYSSRSDFFRVLIRMWFLPSDQKVSPALREEAPESYQEEIDLEYGIPPELVKKFVEKAKLLNK